MTIEEALVAFLAADTAITAVVGSSPARISPAESAQAQAYPRITYSLSHTEDEYTLRLDADQPTISMQVDCWARTQTAAKSLAKLVKDSRGGVGGGLRLKEFYGTMASGPGVVVQACRLEDEYENSTAAADGSERQIACYSLDFVISYIEQ